MLLEMKKAVVKVFEEKLVVLTGDVESFPA